MSNVFFYEPFYDFDRFLEQALNSQAAFNGQNQKNRQLAQRSEVDGAVRSLKPRFVVSFNFVRS